MNAYFFAQECIATLDAQDGHAVVLRCRDRYGVFWRCGVMHADGRLSLSPGWRYKREHALIRAKALAETREYAQNG